MITYLASLFGAVGHKRSPHWRAVEQAHLAKNPQCVCCGGETYLTVHHVKPFNDYPELELDPDNLATTCEHPSRNCHLNIGHSGDWRAWNPHFREDAALMLKRRKERKYDR